MNTPRCFSQCSAGSRTSRRLGAHLPSLGEHAARGERVYPFSLLIYLVLEVLEVLEPLVSKGLILGET